MFHGFVKLNISPLNKVQSNPRWNWVKQGDEMEIEDWSLHGSFSLLRSSSVKEKLREDSLKDLTKERILQMIEEGFETAKAPVIISSSSSSFGQISFCSSWKNITANHR